MFSFLKKRHKKSTEPKIDVDSIYDFKWYEIGKDNPFVQRVLDIRAFTQQMVSTTQDPAIASLFLENRKSVGMEYLDFVFEKSVSISTQLNYPHNGEKIEGAGYKAKEMEDKWDIYCWNNVLYFVRSWTGDVGYKAHITYDDRSFTISEIEFEEENVNQDEQSIAINNVHYLVLTHLFNAIGPHKIPGHLTTFQEIAGYSFSTFGRNCWYATYNDIIGTTGLESKSTQAD